MNRRRGAREPWEWIPLIFLAGLFVAAGCANKTDRTADNVFYTCSMHPQVMEKRPGTCPICKMDLVKVEKSTGANPRAIKLSAEQRALAGVRVAPAAIRTLTREKTVLARIAADPAAVRTVTARLSGRVDRLYVKYEGEKIVAGQFLYELYSEEMSAEVRKFHLFPRSDPAYEAIVKSARRKFELWDLSMDVVEAFDPGSVPEALPVSASVDGVVLSAEVREGDYVAEGAPLFRLADLSKVWAEAEFYESEADEIAAFKTAEVSLNGGDWVNGRIVQIDAGTAAASRKILVRIATDNADRRFKPGMPASARFREKGREVLTVPDEAVLRGSRGAAVVVETGEGFESRMIETGIESGGSVEVISGLSEGDRVAVSGAYLLISEHIFKRGSDPMEGHHH